MGSLTPRRRRRQGQRPQIVLRPPVVTACQLPFVLGYRSRDKALEIRADPAFPRPIRQLGPKSRGVWLLSEVEEYLRRKAAEGRAS
jgi:predicted DNA-binding transcriptional regulator AlpA